MAQAVCDLFPGAKYAIGPPVEDGFYYDFDLPGGARFSEDDLGRIEARMREIVGENQPFVREELSREEGLERFADQPFKVEIIEGVDPEEGAEGSAVERRTGNEGWVDLCRGPHVPSHLTPRLVQAHEGGRRLLAGRRAPPACSSASTARRGSPTRPWPSTCTASRRPSGATTASSASSSTCSTSRPRSAAACRSSIPRAASSASSWRTTPAPSTRRPATPSCGRRTCRSRRCSRSPATSVGTPTACTPPWRWRGRRTTRSP